MSNMLPDPPKYCHEFGGITEDGQMCMNLSGDGRGFITNGMCKDCYFRIEGPQQAKGGPGRPRKWEPEPADIDYIRRLASVLNQEQIAAIFGVSSDTFRRRKVENPEIEQAFNHGKAQAVAAVGASLLKKAHAGDTISQIFYLKAQGDWRDQHTTISGTMKHEVDFKSLREELTKRLDAMDERRDGAKELKPEMFEDAKPAKFEVIDGGLL